MENGKSYNIISKEGSSEIVVTKSRFIGLIVSVSDAEEAENLIARTKKKYHDARHNCWAYVVLEGSLPVSRSSDDGEPSGTAGKPILSVLEGAGLVGVLCIVTRYFGGVLLGTGGLVRAYTDCAKAALENAGISVIRHGLKISLSFDYCDEAMIRRFSESRGFDITSSEYGEKVSFELTGPFDMADDFMVHINDMTGGRVRPEKGDEVYY